LIAQTSDQRLSRRTLLIGAAASFMCAPAVVRAASLMPIRAFIVPIQPIHAGFIERLWFHCIEHALEVGWNAEHASSFGGISENEARRQLAFARMQGWLPTRSGSLIPGPALATALVDEPPRVASITADDNAIGASTSKSSSFHGSRRYQIMS
jgi:hypothetical protein